MLLSARFLSCHFQCSGLAWLLAGLTSLDLPSSANDDQNESVLLLRLDAPSVLPLRAQILHLHIERFLSHLNTEVLDELSFFNGRRMLYFYTFGKQCLLY